MKWERRKHFWVNPKSFFLLLSRFLLSLSINEALSDIVDCNFDYMAYTGFTYEELQEQAINDPKIDKVLGQLDYLVDGKFIDEEKDLTCMFRGSRNQRFIDLRATRESGIIIEKNFSD